MIVIRRWERRDLPGEGAKESHVWTALQAELYDDWAREPSVMVRVVKNPHNGDGMDFSLAELRWLAKVLAEVEAELAKRPA